MNNVKIKSNGNMINVFVDDKEVKAIEELTLKIKAGEIRTLEIKQFAGEVDIETSVDEIKELTKNQKETPVARTTDELPPPTYHLLNLQEYQRIYKEAQQEVPKED